jgi:hypothetical protein
MAAKLSYEEVRRLARIWFAEAREKGVQDEAEVATWTEEQRKRNSYAGGSGSFAAFGGDSDGGDGD